MNHSRRDFLHKFALSSLALPILPSFATEHTRWLRTQPQGPVLRVALLGLGGYAKRVADAMNACQRAKITGLISGTPSKLQTWGELYHVAEKNRYTYADIDDLKNNPDIDAVYVLTPNALHHEHVIRAAKAGKHVICEKPMAVGVREGKEMVAACASAGVKLLIGYRMRFEPNTLDVVRRRMEGTLGPINFFQGQCGFKIGDPNQWRLDKQLAGGGALMDIGIYAINGARYMVGEDPIWVTAQETKTDFNKFKDGVDETIQFQLGFPSGAVASCLSTYAMNFLDRFYLNGEKGFAELWPATGYGPIKGKTNTGTLTFPHIAHQTIQMDEMARILLDGAVPTLAVDGQVGLQDLQIIEAIYQACQTGRRQDIDFS
ncbi:Gfo/Idh/MocA family protein [Sphingobacterium suaedae]|uniref:Gfo/Idh/MocA family protein n=1 Tax=Sphingobacterium suaedae TaxID=1686402 RepID=A0ABW5KF41_9SPHI